MAVDTSVAGILMSLAGINSLDDSENKSESCSSIFEKKNLFFNNQNFEK